MNRRSDDSDADKPWSSRRRWWIVATVTVPSHASTRAPVGLDLRPRRLMSAAVGQLGEPPQRERDAHSSVARVDSHLQLHRASGQYPCTDPGPIGALWKPQSQRRDHAWTGKLGQGHGAAPPQELARYRVRTRLRWLRVRVPAAASRASTSCAWSVGSKVRTPTSSGNTRRRSSRRAGFPSCTPASTAGRASAL
jgi:hypothetical protein